MKILVFAILGSPSAKILCRWWTLWQSTFVVIHISPSNVCHTNYATKTELDNISFLNPAFNYINYWFCVHQGWKLMLTFWHCTTHRNTLTDESSFKVFKKLSFYVENNLVLKQCTYKSFWAVQLENFWLLFSCTVWTFSCLFLTLYLVWQTWCMFTYLVIAV